MSASLAHSSADSPTSKRAWHQAIAETRPYARASYARALWQLTNTLGLYALSLGAMFAIVPSQGSPGLAALAAMLPLAILASVAYMRLFMIGHDAGHGAFLPTRWQNIVVGNLMGVLTNTPIGYWARQHHLHHQGNGNLDKRGDGDVEMMTVDEFREASLAQRIWYRVYRHPAFLFGIAAPVHFVLMQRYPLGHQAKTRSGWLSVIGTTLGIALYYGTLIALFGLIPFLMVMGPVVWLSSAGAVWLFYVQHQYDGTYYRRRPDWDYQRAALEGSSFYDLPRFLHWCCANIGYHHIHHLNPKVPNYRLAKCHAENGLFQGAFHLSLRQSLGAAHLALWDESKHRLVSFREARIPVWNPDDSPASALGEEPLLPEPEATA